MKRNFFFRIIILLLQFTSWFIFSHGGMYPEATVIPLFHSIFRGDHKRFDELLRREKNRPDRLGWALIYASRDGRPKMITKLLAAGANINYEVCGWSPLMYAVFKERTSIIRQLSAQGATELTEAQWDRLSLYHRERYKKNS